MSHKPTGLIAFQGEAGANSDTACRQAYPDLTPLPCATFEDAFNALGTGEADLAMIPIENSLAGRVADIHHLLPASDFHIIGEIFLPIHFQLMVLPGATLDTIRSVHSHVHALGQCREIVRKHNWKTVVDADTAGSARRVSQSGDETMAALAPTLAAKLYGLKILAENIEDAEHNTTRFVVLSRDPCIPPQGPATITTFVFQVRNIPAALYKVLGGFATNTVNMTKLESYQLGGEFAATQFYADIEGHPEDHNVTLALDEMRFFSRYHRILGVYPANPFRDS